MRTPFCVRNERAKCGAVLLVAYLQLKARREVTSMASEVINRAKRIKEKIGNSLSFLLSVLQKFERLLRSERASQVRSLEPY